MIFKIKEEIKRHNDEFSNYLKDKYYNKIKQIEDLLIQKQDPQNCDLLVDLQKLKNKKKEIEGMKIEFKTSIYLTKLLYKISWLEGIECFQTKKFITSNRILSSLKKYNFGFNHYEIGVCYDNIYKKEPYLTTSIYISMEEYTINCLTCEIEKIKSAKNIRFYLLLEKKPEGVNEPFKIKIKETKENQIIGLKELNEDLEIELSIKKKQFDILHDKLRNKTSTSKFLILLAFLLGLGTMLLVLSIF